jgi:hypothetical protein
MRTHDIVCVADGWSYRLDGVDKCQFPSWQLALNEARRAAERESAKGIRVALRYQGLDGEMKDIQTKSKRGFDVFGGRKATDPTTLPSNMSDTSIEARN